MILLCGLGNPGPQYAKTRHNAGFMLLDALREAYSLPPFKAQFKGLTSKGNLGGQPVLLLQPHTYMNLSGASVQAAATFYKIAPTHIFVVHDELDLPLGTFKYKQGGGDAGHNGLKSITAALGANYHRLRLGISRPTGPIAVEDYVLQPFSAPELKALETTLNKLTENFAALLENPIQTLAKLGNSKA